MGSEVATQAPAGVPDLKRPTDPYSLTADDIAVPRLYLGQAISKPVEEGLVKSGEFFVAQDDSDPDPQVVAANGEEFRLHILGWRKGISRSIDGVLESWAFDDPTAPVPSKHTGAWTTYTYYVAIPAVATDLPYRWLLSRTQQPAAQKINTTILRNQDTIPPWKLAFEVSSTKRANKKGQQFYVPQVAQVEPTSEELEVAEALYAIAEAKRQQIDSQAARDAADPSL
jgi:hypothetical protein